MWTASYGQHRERSRCRNGKIIIGNVSNENDETLTHNNRTLHHEKTLPSGSDGAVFLIRQSKYLLPRICHVRLVRIHWPLHIYKIQISSSLLLLQAAVLKSHVFEPNCSCSSFGDEDRAQDENAIYNALKIACADDFVRRLESGLDTVLGERGAGLSEGQMQRIAIARAIYSNHPILLLDEATSALDEATALRLLNNLRKMTDKTVILVTHRMNQAGFFDAELAFSKDGICVRERKTCK